MSRYSRPPRPTLLLVDGQVVNVQTLNQIFKDESAGLVLGAVVFRSKPVNASVVRARVRTHLMLSQPLHQVQDLNENLETPLGSSAIAAKPNAGLNVVTYQSRKYGRDMNIVSVCCIVVMGVALLVQAGCSSTPLTHIATRYTEPVAALPRLTEDQAGDVTIYAIGLVGTPYRFGGNTPESGFDCSGLIGHVYLTRARVAPPRTVSRLNDWGSPVPSDKIRSGDLVLFFQGGTVGHAGIYVGDGRFVHAPSGGGVVRVDSLRSKYWAGQSVAFRRP